MQGANRSATEFSRRQRRAPSVAVGRVWQHVRGRRLAGFKFVREEPIGPYTVDFCCRERKLVVEIDGSQHVDSERDRVRDAWLRAHGYQVLRFWNSDVLSETEGVIAAIIAALAEEVAFDEAPHPSLSPRAGSGNRQNRPVSTRRERGG
jgi:very-short-patch-repair endonuclease